MALHSLYSYVTGTSTHSVLTASGSVKLRGDVTATQNLRVAQQLKRHHRGEKPCLQNSETDMLTQQLSCPGHGNMSIMNNLES